MNLDSQSYCPDGKIVYELCNSGKIVCTRRKLQILPGNGDLCSRYMPLPKLTEVHPGSYPILKRVEFGTKQDTYFRY